MNLMEQIFAGKFQLFLSSVVQKPFHLLRYACIKGYLQSKMTAIVITFVVSFAQDFRKFIKTFKTNAPLIDLLLLKMPGVVVHHIRQIPEDESFLGKKCDQGQGYPRKHINNGYEYEDGYEATFQPFMQKFMQFVVSI